MVTRIVTTNTGKKYKITVSQPKRDSEGKTATDRVIERNKSRRSSGGSSSSSSSQPINYTPIEPVTEAPKSSSSSSSNLQSIAPELTKNYTPVGDSKAPTVSKSYVDPGLAYGGGTIQELAMATGQSPYNIKKEDGTEYKTAEQKINYGTREITTTYSDGRVVRSTINPIAENVRQGGTVSFRDPGPGEGGRPQISGFTPSPKATNLKYDNKGNVTSFELKANPYIKGPDVKLGVDKDLSFSEKLIRSGEKDVIKAYRSPNPWEVQYLNYVGRSKKILGYAGETLKKPTPYLVVGGLTLLATKNPALATSIGEAGAVAFYGSSIYNIGKGNVEPEQPLGEGLAYAGIGYGFSKGIQAYKTSVERANLKVVKSKGVSKTVVGETQIVGETKGASRVKGEYSDFLIDSSSTTKTPKTFQELAVTKGSGKYTVRDLTKSGELVDTGKFDLSGVNKDLFSKTDIKVTTGEGKNLKFIDETFSIKTDTGSKDLSLLYGKNNKLLQAQTGVTESIYKNSVYSEGGNLIGLESSDYFVKAGVRSDKGLDLLKIEPYTVGKKANLPKSDGSGGFSFTNIYAKKLTGTSSDIVVGATSGNQKYLKIFEGVGLPKSSVVEATVLEVAKANVKVDTATVLTAQTKIINADTSKSSIGNKGGVVVTVPKIKQKVKDPLSTKSLLPVIEEPKSITIPDLTTKTKGSSRSSSKIGQGSIIAPISIVDQGQRSEQAVKQIVEITPDLTQKLDRKVIGDFSLPGSFDFTPGPKIEFPQLPGLPGGGGGGYGKFRYSNRARAKTTYNPTVYSIVTSYKAKGVKTKGLGVKSGLGLRPIKSEKKKKIKLKF